MIYRNFDGVFVGIEMLAKSLSWRLDRKKGISFTLTLCEKNQYTRVTFEETISGCFRGYRFLRTLERLQHKPLNNVHFSGILSTWQQQQAAQEMYSNPFLNRR